MTHSMVETLLQAVVSFSPETRIRSLRALASLDRKKKRAFSSVLFRHRQELILDLGLQRYAFSTFSKAK
jgi:hypothetical protein